MSRLPISVCIIAKNEEKHMEQCLKHLKPLGVEIVVTDTGSTDNTKAIAKRYADKVLDFEWIDDFSAARNFCSDNASNDWILALDCDEYVMSLNEKDLRLLMDKLPTFVGTVRLKNIVNNKGNKGYGIDDVIRFYNRKIYTYDKPIHEQVCTIDASKRDEMMQCFLMPMEVIHHGYDISDEEMEAKQQRNLKLLYKSLEKEKKDPYLYFQIGQSEYIIGNYEKSIEYYTKGLSLNPDTKFTYVQIMVTSLAKAYMLLDRQQEALTVMQQYASRINTAKYVFTHASILLDCGQTLQALVLYLKTIAMPEVDTLGENLMHCYGHVIQIYESMGQQQMADMFKEKYLNTKKEYERVMME